MSNHIKLQRHYNTTLRDCFSKFKADIKQQEDFETKIYKREQMIDNCLNTLNLLGFNNEEVDPTELANVVTKRPHPSRRRTQSQNSKKSLSINTMDFKTIDRTTNHNTINAYTDRKPYFHKNKVTPYPFCQTLSSTKSDFKFRMITQYSPSRQSTKGDCFLTQYNHKKTKPVIKTSRIQTASNIDNRIEKKNKKGNILPRLSIKDIRLRFPKKKFESIYQDFNMFSHKTDALSEKLIKDTEQMTKPVDEKTKEKLKEAKVENENPIKKSRNISSVLNKASGVMNMIDKSHADLINFGDHYLKFNDEEFYHRSKEILQDYEFIRHHAKIEANLPQSKSHRLNKFHKNEFIIAKTFQLVKDEHKKFINTLENFNPKSKKE